MIIDASPWTSHVALSGPNSPGSFSTGTLRSLSSAEPDNMRRTPRANSERKSWIGEVGVEVTRVQRRSVTPTGGAGRYRRPGRTRR